MSFGSQYTYPLCKTDTVSGFCHISRAFRDKAQPLCCNKDIRNSPPTIPISRLFSLQTQAHRGTSVGMQYSVSHKEPQLHTLIHSWLSGYFSGDRADLRFDLWNSQSEAVRSEPCSCSKVRCLLPSRGSSRGHLSLL